MTYRHKLAIIALILVVMTAIPVMAADPAATKRVVAQSDDASVLAIEVSVTGRAVHSVMITDASGSIVDVVAPKGWVGITSGERTLFRSDDKPIVSGEKVVFTVLTTNASAPLDVSYRGAKTPIGGKQSI
ncbi:MAG: hypothetical protein JSW50_07385 [Candidatus Latescibacterota bacterium]|nr:MAG: hypothetical protein JSW50_07385 [Candidatus Latescibacterota bacterium]